MANLSLRHLRTVNLERCTKGFKHNLSDWSIAEWTNAMAGEAGEACNIAKKLIRERDNMGFLNKGVPINDLMLKLGEEIADTVIYADLVAAAVNLDLARIIVNKFNEDSIQRGYTDYMLQYS